MLRLALLSLFASISLGSLAACGQGEGEYCQVKSDCTSGLDCVPATHTCQKPGSTSGTDGGEPDAKPVDANTPPDAMPPHD